jgi:hypothetical protein
LAKLKTFEKMKVYLICYEQRSICGSVQLSKI